ncbi:hypothetical protein APS56_06940 [Pseudalgibacter alginicilyticus]|uniref:HTH araC/xylS-type domain-containing protein n=1 Tax=Pseudalgibacter alginicilyticus TaxID=1736674 RepID=A0A0P0D431_9FLAO|nr:AraC family transcriptional regulator [Pseudalgibacter alginicilyticus]ALJ04871.1 hypothetical protein APS56_06940 [Pseudalgibacter alginicilyticus]
MNYKRIFLQALLLFCEQQNIDIEKLASISGFKVQDLFSAKDFSIDHNKLELLWRNLIQNSGDELIGLRFGATMQIAALDAVGQIIQTSNTVKDALLQAASLIHLFTDMFSMQLIDNGETFSIVLKKNKKFKNYPNTFNQMGDFLMAFTLHELDGLLLKSLHPIKAEMPTFKAEHLPIYDEILNCPIQKKESYLLEFDNKYLNTRIITANHDLQKLLLKHVESKENSYEGKKEFSAAIFNFLTANSYLFSISVEFVASNFNMSVRTLQRKLKEEGVSYIQIVEEVKKSLAIHYIQNGSSSVKEIAHILGYAETSGFAKAFKKWTGKSPTTYRKQNI